MRLGAGKDDQASAGHYRNNPFSDGQRKGRSMKQFTTISGFVAAEIKTNDQGDRMYVEVITTLTPSLILFEACDKIMKPFNIIFRHQTLEHYVLHFIY